VIPLVKAGIDPVLLFWKKCTVPDYMYLTSLLPRWSLQSQFALAILAFACQLNSPISLVVQINASQFVGSIGQLKVSLPSRLTAALGPALPFDFPRFQAI
jgi:hypothetical protein